jgi:hypothetical protein
MFPNQDQNGSSGPGKSCRRDWNARFIQALEKRAAPGRPLTAHGTAPRRPDYLARKSARAVRAELQGSSSAESRIEQSIIEPSAEEIQRFNRFWDGLLPARHRSDLPTEAAMIVVQPLPRSLSLVLVENVKA